MIEAHNLTKQYGKTTAVDDLSFEVRPGTVTGFLGPNGSGKSTTMRLIMGLDAPNRGSVSVNGRKYHDLPWPLHEVGALLEARAVHPGRTGYNHLLALAQTHGISRKRVDEVLDLVGLSQVARRRVGKFSLGMGQRLGIAVAMLGDPEILLFDEPVNGLDPEGIRWVRTLLKGLAAEGRTVFVSSHLMSEMALTADDVLVIGKGKLLASMAMQDFIVQNSRSVVRVRTPEPDKLSLELRSRNPDIDLAPGEDGALIISGVGLQQVGDAAFVAGAPVYELTVERASLEDVFMELTHESVEFKAGVDDDSDH